MVDFPLDVYYNKSVIRKGIVNMENKNKNVNENNEMTPVVGGGLLKGILVGLALEVLAVVVLIGIGRILALL
jgi:uncharacterized membrane protein (Fun14 family)